MKGAKTSLLIVLVGGIVVGILTYACKSREPHYQGKRLGLWLNELVDSESTKEQRTRAEEALVQIGTNALPQLMTMLCQKDSSLGMKIMEFSKRYLTIDFHVTRDDRRFQALMALRVLGSRAKPAIPLLNTLLYEDDTAFSAASGLAAIGQDAIWPLTNALTNPDKKIRVSVAAALGEFRGEAKAVLPALISALNDEEYRVRGFAAFSLGEIHQSPATVVPALTELLEDTNAFVRRRAAEALGKYGAAATPALPALLKATGDQDRGVREAAAGALRKDDSAAKNEGGIK